MTAGRAEQSGMTTFETVRDMMVDQFKLDPAQVTPDATLESLKIDSLSAVQFMFLLEEKFELQAWRFRVYIYKIERSRYRF